MTIRVAIDLRMAGHSGIGRYLRALLGEMARQEGIRFTGILNPSQDSAWLPSGVEPSVLAREIPVYSLAEHFRLGRFLDQVPCDLVHVPHFNVSRWAPARPLVVTIHDLAYIEFSDQGRTFLHTMAARRLIRRSARYASRILTVSEFSRRRIGELLGARITQKTRVVLHGAEHLPAPPEGPGPARDPATLLYVGNHLPHKNLPFLMEVLARVADARPQVRLELTGARSRHTAAVEEAARRHGVDQRIVWLGDLDDNALVEAYRRATLLLHPSTYEGFGFSVLEAMRQGLPVVSSDAASLPEVVGDAGLLLAPGDPGLWSAHVALLLADPARRAELSRRGMTRARAFSWAEAARRTVAVYQEALEKQDL